ncbi:MAG TPA: DUF3047 domain-containing protein [Geobacteraceae bacterium]|nr:DUF3047 domain-containing protein [Geobacteraceae bacterium]
MIRYLVVPMIVALLAGVSLAVDLNVGNFTAGDLCGWKPKAFNGHTQYCLARDGDKCVLKAYSRNSASSLYKMVKVDPVEYPLLRWSWKIDHTLKREDATRKSGDDFAARVYVVFPGTFFWTTKAITYVWSGKLPKGASIKNPYNSNAIMIVAESGDGQVGKWVNEERNYYLDYKRIFGEEPPKLGAVAVMTDTDDTRDEVTAWYGDIFLARGIRK